VVCSVYVNLIFPKRQEVRANKVKIATYAMDEEHFGSL
jgi:hypothetical protein